MGKVRKTHSYDENIYEDATKIAIKLSHDGFKFTLSNYLNDKLRELVNVYKHLL